ncbi:unnamed protein product [Thelazia callipaeda]|uniref:52 kDa repressor of the inhibitor of the protein kinase-like n=1 Tax=Thelazia callipaeda TaxID=103827 RepID=A0A0N5CRU1_THECL|nr:unnamed protein product [Thelazia callipaeda]
MGKGFFFIRLPYTITLRQVRNNAFCDELFPSGKYRFGCVFRDDNTGMRDGFYTSMKPVVEVATDYEFVKKVKNLLKTWHLKKSSLIISTDLLFDCREFLTYQVLPEQKVTEEEECIRQALVQELETLEFDSDIDATDGVCLANRSIQFAYSAYFQECLANSIFTNNIVLPFPLATFKKVRNALFFGILSFTNCSQEDITLFISCAQFLKSNFGKESSALVADAEREVIRRFCQCWQHASLEEVLEYLRISLKYALVNLRKLVLIVIVDCHYEKFK